MKYTTVIGLEIHAELSTRTKLFCGCINEFGGAENSRCCPVCMGLPGALPVLNRQAVEFAIQAGIALNCRIAEYTKWDRKNYFYPDSPKAYQISQLYAPLCIGGGLDIDGRHIRINNIHVEEDAGKLVHSGKYSYIDLNRCSVPLIEIVTEPDMRSAEEAIKFLETVRQTLIYAGVCDGRMEQGSIRCDANVSVMPEGAKVLGTRTETKNLNSFRHIKSAIEYETARQIEIIEKGGKVLQQTRKFNVESGDTSPMRSKEDAEDYRYFPDPDILPLRISQSEIAKLKSKLAEMPAVRRARYTEQFGFSYVDSDTLLATPALSDLFDRTVAGGFAPSRTLNLINTEIRRYLTSNNVPLTEEDFKYLLELEDEGKLTKEGLKKAIGLIFATGKTAREVVRENSLIVVENLQELDEVIGEAISANEKAVKQYINGDDKVFSFLIGQCNRVLRGKVQITTLQEKLRAELEKLKG